MKNTGNILRWIIMATLMSLMFVNLSCTQESTHTIETIETETLYYFKATVRVVRLDYNTRGVLFRTHAQEFVRAEEHGIRWAEVERLRTLWDRENTSENFDICTNNGLIYEEGKCATWIINTSYKVIYTRTH